MELELPRIRGFRGRVHLPGSKSIGNRALLLAALAEGTTTLTHVPDSEDVRVLIKNLPLLGVSVREMPDDPSALVIEGCAGPFSANGGRLNLENAGTAMRPLTALVAAGRGEFVLDGNEQMRRRPISDLTTALKKLGVDVECSESDCPPVRVRAAGLPGGRTEVSGEVSSQFVSALLMAAPLAQHEDLTIVLSAEPVSKPYIDLTLGMMEDFGVKVERKGYTEFHVPRATYVSPGSYAVEGDASAATYFLALGALPGSGPVTVHDILPNSRQGDARFADLLRDMGADISWQGDEITARGPASGKLRALNVDMNAMPDAAMTLAVIALFAEGTTHIRNIANLRVKESERIRGLRLELEKLGARVQEEHDSLHVTPPAELVPATVCTYQDHRMAMAFAIASFGTRLAIENPSCVNKTYPRFFHDFFAVALAANETATRNTLPS